MTRTEEGATTMRRSRLRWIATAVVLWLVWAMDSHGQGARQGAKKESLITNVREIPLRKLEGDWELVAIRRFGSELKYVRESDAMLNNLTIAEGYVRLPIYLDIERVGVSYVKFKLRDASTDAPPDSEGWIDLVNQDDEDPAQKMRGIYKTEGNILLICFNPTGGKFRPRTFGTAPGSDQQLIIMRRRKSRSASVNADP
jgi:uncharacterized protein (TIGR03067 family)